MVGYGKRKTTRRQFMAEVNHCQLKRAALTLPCRYIPMHRASDGRVFGAVYNAPDCGNVQGAIEIGVHHGTTV